MTDARKEGTISDLTERYRHKIKSVDELKSCIGPRPRENKVIMCHGVFDVVHPGHVRHLLYAKSKAEILVASITADQFITKGKYRPHVPENLRAANLAAFEMVDYVTIDTNAEPLENIKILQPDFFAKGYEYVANGMPARTSAESDAVATYGGEIIFTPGDIVYSSSKFIDQSSPAITIDKLLSLMNEERIGFDDLRHTLRNLGSVRCHIVGDTIVDTFTQTTMIGGQTKTPTLSVRLEGKTDYIGGAGIVAQHMSAAGADVVFSTILGDDELGKFVLDGLKQSGIECSPIIDHTRPTTNKNAIIAEGYRLLKIDTLDNSSISDSTLDELTDAIRETPCDATIFSDFRHGIFNSRTIPLLIEAIREDSFRVADSQVASRWGNITDFKGFDLITPNEREARFALADQDAGIRPLASKLYDAAQCKILIMKLGDRGVLTSRSADHVSLDSYFVVDSYASNIVDSVGAGDALLAYATLSMLATKSPVVATILGSIAAACECEINGNIPIAPDDVEKKIDFIERQANYG